MCCGLLPKLAGTLPCRKWRTASLSHELFSTGGTEQLWPRLVRKEAQNNSGGRVVRRKSELSEDKVGFLRNSDPELRRNVELSEDKV